MGDYDKLIEDHYSQTGLDHTIFAALKKYGGEIKSHKDTAAFDEFHIRGREATRELAQLAGLHAGLSVIDLGCGIGGPARTLASEFGCQVTGIDLIQEYCHTATRLTERVGLTDSVSFRQGNALAPPFDDHTFDVALTFHITMNIADKPQLCNSIRRILKPGGRWVLYEICAGPVSPPHFPVPWAGDAAISFLSTPEALNQILHQAGLTTLHWRDVSAHSLKWLQSLRTGKAARPEKEAPPPGIHLLMGHAAPEKMTNMIRSLAENRISIIQGVCQSPENPR